ncbi:hypothetical protein ACH4MN_36770 [Streptomyces anulatus]
MSTDELVEDLKRRYGEGVKLASWTRMLKNTQGVVERPWSAPLEENVARAGVGVGVPPALPSADRRDPVSPT